MLLRIFVLLALQFAPIVQACTPAPNTNGTSTYPYTIPGTDDPADWATTGYVLNHFALNVKNLTASIDFYTKVFGMRLIFNFRATEHFSIAYIAHSHGGKNGTQYQTAAELNRNKNNMEGMIELLHYDDSGVDLSPSTRNSNTFSHLGIVVPHLNSTQARLQELGVRIIKETGQPTDGLDEEEKKFVAEAYGLGDFFDTSPQEAEALFKLLLEQVPGAIDYIMVVDPDGNLIEIQSQDQQQLPV